MAGYAVRGRHSGSVYQDSLPDFVALAESYGHVVRVTDPAKLDEAMAEVFSPALRIGLCSSMWPWIRTSMSTPCGCAGSLRDMLLSKTERS